MGCNVRTAMDILHGNARLLNFYVRSVAGHFRLPRELYDKECLDSKIAEGEPFEVRVNGGLDYVHNYEDGLRRLGRTLARSVPLDFTTKQVLFWLIRLACILCAFSGSVKLTLAASSLQFVVLPYSLSLGTMYCIETGLMLYLPSAIVFPLLQFILKRLLPTSLSSLSITLGPRIMLLFLLADQLTCTVLLFQTPDGRATPMATRRVFQSILYGFLNCKTFYLVVFPLAFGVEVPIVPWIVDAALGLSDAACSVGTRYWEVFFYHAHRLGHVRSVYPDGHKFHHYLPDATPFDSHFVGLGAPEEWPLLLVDVVMSACCGWIPPSLSYPSLKVSWHSKYHQHVRTDLPEGHAGNHHADHHYVHNVNFGLGYPYDLLMGTVPSKLSEGVEYCGFNIERIAHGETLTLRFSPLRGQKGGVAEVRRDVPVAGTLLSRPTVSMESTQNECCRSKAVFG